MQRFHRITGILVLAAFGLAMVPSISQAGSSFRRGWRGRTVRGSGDMQTEKRDIGEFTEIDNSLCCDVYVTIGDDRSVEITFDDNLLEFIVTEVDGGILFIEGDGSFSSRRSCRIDITTPELTEVRISGSGDADIRGLDCERFYYQISGSGDFYGEGRAKDLRMSISGSGDVETRDLIAEVVEVDISGSGDARVFASQSLEAHVSGSGDIYYYGDPEDVHRSISGSGRIRKR
jgi:hypothetical protein